MVPAYDEERFLAPTLRAIHRAAGAVGCLYEIVVADDASRDRTALVARRRGARVVAVHHRQIAATRNAGARAARAPTLIFVDADTRVTAGAVRGALAAVEAGAVGGGCAVAFDGSIPLYARLLLPLAMLFYRVVGIASGSFLYCTRAAFESAGGFDESLYAAEEWEMSKALRRRGRFVFLRARVTTSGRKLRAYTGPHILGLSLRLLIGGRRALHTRTGLELWYRDPRAGA